jgi:hypothetical protein
VSSIGGLFRGKVSKIYFVVVSGQKLFMVTLAELSPPQVDRRIINIRMGLHWSLFNFHFTCASYTDTSTEIDAGLVVWSGCSRELPFIFTIPLDSQCGPSNNIPRPNLIASICSSLSAKL